MGQTDMALLRCSWTKVKVAQGENHIRTHTCHAIGSQLLVVGGYPPGFTVEPDVPCANELIRVLDMNTLSVSQKPSRAYSRRDFPLT